MRSQLEHIVRDLHANPELAFEASWESANFDPERHSTIVVMAEYDALPEIGHACGHNLIAAAGRSR